MRTLAVLLLLLVLSGLPAPRLHAQAVVDTVFTWQGYHRTAHCRLRIYRTPPDDKRTRTVVVQELAGNAGPSTLADAPHLAELIGRRFGIDPAEAYWVLYWGDFSFEGARAAAHKEVFLRATFRRTRSQALSAPSWRVVTREDVEALTDRQFR